MPGTERIVERTPEAISDYLDDVIAQIKKAREDPKNWKINETFHSHIVVRSATEEGE